MRSPQSTRRAVSPALPWKPSTKSLPRHWAIIPPMPIGTAFHSRTAPLCHSMAWRDWSGYFAASSYEVHPEREYNAIRHATALIDVSPLYKYRVSGKDARRLADRIVTRDLTRLAPGHVGYTNWCDGD